MPLSSVLVEVKSNDKTFDVGTKKIIIATGSSSLQVPTLPFEEDIIIPTDDIFKNHSIPKRVFIMGAGSSSCELSNFYQRIGSKVFLGADEPTQKITFNVFSHARNIFLLIIPSDSA